MERTTLASLIAVLVVGTVIGFYVGNRMGVAQGGALARKQLEAGGVIPKKPERVLSIGGEVESIVAGGTLTFRAQAFTDPLRPDLGPTSYTVTFGPTTQFVWRTTNVAMPQAGKPLPPYTEVAIAASAIQQGNRVIVESADNILGKDSFAATRVILVQ